jgi:hypothetical protein
LVITLIAKGLAAAWRIVRSNDVGKKKGGLPPALVASRQIRLSLQDGGRLSY